MSAPSTIRPAVLPETSGRSWHDPEPARRAWMQGSRVRIPVVGWSREDRQDVDTLLHRVERWRRAADGRIYTRCGASSSLWIEPHPWKVSDGKFMHCVHCEDPDDYR